MGRGPAAGTVASADAVHRSCPGSQARSGAAAAEAAELLRAALHATAPTARQPPRSWQKSHFEVGKSSAWERFDVRCWGGSGCSGCFLCTAVCRFQLKEQSSSADG